MRCACAERCASARAARQHGTAQPARIGRQARMLCGPTSARAHLPLQLRARGGGRARAGRRRRGARLGALGARRRLGRALLRGRALARQLRQRRAARRELGVPRAQLGVLGGGRGRRARGRRLRRRERGGVHVGQVLLRPHPGGQHASPSSGLSCNAVFRFAEHALPSSSLSAHAMSRS